jgi:hypothetical protein
MVDTAKRAGVRSPAVRACHSLRKWTTTQLINSKVNPEIREMLLGHSIGLASSYYRPTEQEMFEEYQKAENALTIDPTQRLVRENKQLKFENSQMSDLAAKYEEMRSFIGMK